MPGVVLYVHPLTPQFLQFTFKLQTLLDNAFNVIKYNY